MRHDENMYIDDYTFIREHMKNLRITQCDKEKYNDGNGDGDCGMIGGKLVETQYKYCEDIHTGPGRDHGYSVANCGDMRGNGNFKNTYENMAPCNINMDDFIAWMTTEELSQ